MPEINSTPSNLDLFVRSGIKLAWFVPNLGMFLVVYFLYFLSHDATTFGFKIGGKE
jgi:hypothetical protein